MKNVRSSRTYKSLSFLDLENKKREYHLTYGFCRINACLAGRTFWWWYRGERHVYGKLNFSQDSQNWLSASAEEHARPQRPLKFNCDFVRGLTSGTASCLFF